MRAEDLLDAIGQVDDGCVQRAREKQPARKRGWLAVGALAACLVLVLCSPLMIALRGANSAAPEGIGGDKTGDAENGDLAIQYADTRIYYVDGDTVRYAVRYLPQTAEEIFTAWREKNDIGGEVVLLDAVIEDNGTTVDNGETVEHTVGDYFILRLTVSENLKEYFEALDEALLLDSLKHTMTGYSGIDFDEYHLQLRACKSATID
ncbi:MAG: hypothetical protein IJ518_05440 [Clostridia bacterium]|nr:hypothetical protein [Clostridia bacterium]